MSTFTRHHGAFVFTVWGTGTSCLLEHNGRSVYWQGDEACEISDLVDERGADVLPSIWDDYEHVSTSDEED